MPKFEVIRPWHGVAMGVVFDAKEINPALASHVRAIADGAMGEVTPATPEATSQGKRGPKPKSHDNQRDGA